LEDQLTWNEWSSSGSTESGSKTLAELGCCSKRGKELFLANEHNESVRAV